jgi:hypothetical protein
VRQKIDGAMVEYQNLVKKVLARKMPHTPITLQQKQSEDTTRASSGWCEPKAESSDDNKLAPPRWWQYRNSHTQSSKKQNTGRGKSVATSAVEVNQRQRTLQISINLEKNQRIKYLENQPHVTATETLMTRNRHDEGSNAETATTQTLVRPEDAK